MPLSHVYKGGGEEAGHRCGAPRGGSPTWTPGPSRIRPPFLFPLGEGGKEEEETRKGGPHPTPSPIRFGLGGCATNWPLPPLPTRAHEGPLTPRRVSVTPRYSGKCPNLSETIPVSKHNLPIYQSLCLDHFETPRHVRDLIRDS